jgi:hypothetical protein
MNLSKKATLEVNPHQWIYFNILLDVEDNFYTYQPSIPVYQEGQGLCAAGQVALKKAGQKLFGDFTLHKVKGLALLYPHLVFDLFGKVYAVMLLPLPPQDHSILNLAQQVGTDL